MKIILCLSQKYGDAFLKCIKLIPKLSAVLISSDANFAKSSSVEHGIDLIYMDPLNQEIFQMKQLINADIVIAATENTLVNLNISMLYKSSLNVKKSVVLVNKSMEVVSNYAELYNIDVSMEEENLIIDIVCNTFSINDKLNTLIPSKDVAIYFSSLPNSDDKSLSLEELKSDLLFKTNNFIQISKLALLLQASSDDKKTCAILGSDLQSFRLIHEKMQKLFNKFVVSTYSDDVCMGIAEKFPDVDVIFDSKLNISNFETVDNLFIAYRERHANLFASLYFRDLCKSKPFVLSYNENEETVMKHNNFARVINVPNAVAVSTINALIFNLNKVVFIKITKNIRCYFFLKDLSADDISEISDSLSETDVILDYSSSGEYHVLSSLSELKGNLICLTDKELNVSDEGNIPGPCFDVNM